MSTGEKRVAVIIEPAHPARILPLLMAAYGLTERERDVTALVLQGSSTAQIARTHGHRRTGWTRHARERRCGPPG